MKDVYRRRLSSEEAREGYVLILRDRLSFFPPIGRRFNLAGPGVAQTEAAVEARPCICRGPDLPHEHYFIRLPGLARGQEIEIARLPGSPGAYALRVSG